MKSDNNDFALKTDSTEDNAVTKALFIQKKHIQTVEEKFQLYQSLLTLPAETKKDSTTSNQRFLLRYLSLQLLNQQAFAVSQAIQDSKLNDTPTTRLYAIDPHILVTYADCFNDNGFKGYSLLHNFPSAKQPNEQLQALLTLLNDSLNSHVKFLLLDQGVRELAAHLGFLKGKANKGDDTSDNGEDPTTVAVETILAQITSANNHSKKEKEETSKERLDDDANSKMAYSIFSNIANSTALTRMQKILRKDTTKGGFYSLEQFPFPVKPNSHSWPALLEQINSAKGSTAYFQVQREFRRLYQQFTRLIWPEDKSVIRDIEDEDESATINNIDALFEIHFLNTFFETNQLDIEICYISFSPKVTQFANLFTYGAIRVQVIHPRFLPIYLSLDNSQPTENTDKWAKVIKNINTILTAARFTRNDLLDRKIDTSQYLLNEQKLIDCFNKVEAPLQGIQQLYNVTSGKEDLATIVNHLDNTFNKIAAALAKHPATATISAAELKANFEEIVNKWKNNAVEFTREKRRGVVKSTTEQLLISLQNNEIELAPVVARKVIKPNGLMYIVFLPTLGAARYSFAIPYSDSDSKQWIKDLELGNKTDISSFKPTDKMLEVFQNFLTRNETKCIGKDQTRINIVRDLISGILCIASYHWPLAKSLFDKARKSCEKALREQHATEIDPIRKNMIRLLQQESAFFYHVAERGNIEHNFVGKQLAKKLLQAHQTITELVKSFIDFYNEVVTDTDKTFTLPNSPAQPRVHPLAARIGLSTINNLLELFDSPEAIAIITNDSNKYAKLSIMGGDYKLDGKSPIDIKDYKGPLFDDLMALSMTKAVTKRIESLEACRKSCLRATNLLAGELSSIGSEVSDTHSKFFLKYRQHKILQTAIMIDFMQQLEFYSIDNHTWPDNINSQDTTRPWGRIITKNDEEWQSRRKLFEDYKKLYQDIINTIKDKNDKLEPKHMLAEILCTIGAVLYGTDGDSQSFRRLLLNDFSTANNESKTKPFPVTYASYLLTKLNELDTRINQQQSVGFPGRFSQKMKKIIAGKTEQFLRLLANGIKNKHIDPYQD